MASRRSLIPLSSVFTESAVFIASFGVIATMMAVYGVAPHPAVLWLPVVSADHDLGGRVCLPGIALRPGSGRPVPSGSAWCAILFFIGPGLVPLSQTSAQTSDWLRLNPLTGLFESFRDMFLYGRSPSAENLLYPLAWGLILLCVVRAPLPARSA